MQVSLRTNCLTIGSCLFSLVPMVFLLAYILNSCEGGCHETTEQKMNLIYFLSAMYLTPVISLVIDNIPRRKQPTSEVVN